MTKLSSLRKNEKKHSRRLANEKLYVFEYEDVEEDDHIPRTFKTRIPSKQQYKRLKNKYFIQNFTYKRQPDVKILKTEIRNRRKPNLDISIHTPRLSSTFDDSQTTPPHSALSFHIQPDWSDFEDTEHFQFVSEMDVDLSKVFKLFDDKQIADFGVYDDVCLACDQSADSSLASWASDLSGHRYDHALPTISFIENIIKSNYSTIFNLNFKAPIWTKSLSDANRLLIFCEANKCLFQDLMTKEYSESMQNNCLKWTELGTRCSLLKSCLENIVHFDDVKRNLDTALDVLYEQCLSMIDHGLEYPDPLVVRIIDGIKTIVMNIQTQFNRISVILEDLFDSSDQCKKPILDNVEEEIKKLEESHQIMPLVESLRKYLGKKPKGTEEPVLNFCF